MSAQLLDDPTWCDPLATYPGDPPRKRNIWFPRCGRCRSRVKDHICGLLKADDPAWMLWTWAGDTLIESCPDCGSTFAEHRCHMASERPAEWLKPETRGQLW